MIMKINKIFACGMMILAAAGCAKNSFTSSNEQSLQYIEAWLMKNYPAATEEGNGIYVLENTPGTGAAYDGEEYVSVSFTISSMDGTISSTTDEKIAQQIGTYEPGNYYGDKIWYTAENKITVGMEDLLKGMKVGQVKKVLIPGWLNVYTRHDKKDEYFKDTQNTGSNAIYEVKLLGFTKDIYEWQAGQVDEFCEKELGHKLDTVSRGFWYRQIKAPVSDKAYPKDTTIYVNYTGRLLNGQVFDTTIRDTAKKYSIFSASRSYEPVKITLAEKAEDVKMNGSEAIRGFQMTLKKLGRYERGVGIFVSDLGYGASGSGSKIMPYTPLIFDIEVTDPAD